MQTRSAVNRVSVVALAALLLAGAAACGRGGDNANHAANANAAATNANTYGNTAVNTATSGVSDTALKNTVEANLTKHGVTGVTVTVSNGEVTLGGSVPRAKLQDAMKAANDANPKKVNNQMNIQ